MSESSYETAVAEQNSQEQQSGSTTLELSIDDFAALEERVVRAVELVKRERSARSAAEGRATEAENNLQDEWQKTENLQKEVNSLRGERDQIRQRVERLLSQLDALEL